MKTQRRSSTALVFHHRTEPRRSGKPCDSAEDHDAPRADPGRADEEGIADSMIRFSIGMEAAEDLIEDLNNALETI